MMKTNMGNPPSSNLFSQKTSDYLLYADDTNIEYNDINEILPKLQAYKEAAEPENFIINWEKVFILIMNKYKNKYKQHIAKFHKPFCNIKYETKAKVLGHIMDSTNNLNNAINDRIQKSNKAWGMLNGETIRETDH